jgi:hypothetical protein
MKRWRVEVNLDKSRVMLTLSRGWVLVGPSREIRRWAKTTLKIGGHGKRDRLAVRVDDDLSLAYTREAGQALAHRVIAALDAALLAKQPTPKPKPPPPPPDPEDEEGEQVEDPKAVPA